MSNVYISEPPTTGHVIITTNTYGSIDIHLYCKECPTITKYFLQLCLHEYYNNVLFHRILSNLLIQTGLVRYTGDNSSSSKSKSNSHAITSEQQQQQMKEYNKVIHANESYERSKYEIHSRIRFNHRGQVAMALPIDNNDNTAEEIQEMQPQFFITTDEAPYLNGKHVIFGTVVGPTIFNVIRINQYSTSGFEGGEGGGDGDGDDKSHTRMIDTNDSSAPRIISIKIVTNPFEQSMIPKSLVAIPWLQLNSTDETTTFNSNNSSNNNNVKKKKRKGKLDINVLSFGDEIENVTTIAVANTKKKQYSDTVTPQQLEQNNSSETVEATTTKSFTAIGITTVTHRHDEQQQLPDDVQIPPHEFPVSRDDELPLQQQSQLESNDDIKPVSKPMSAVEAHRAKYLSKKQKRDIANNNNNNNNNIVSSKQKRDDETLNKLLHFRRKIHDVTLQSKNDTIAVVQQLQQDDSLATRMARRAQQQADEERKKYDMNYKDNDPHSIPSYHGQILHDDNNDDDHIDPNKWMQTKFVCKKHMDHLSGDNKDAMEEYVVIDPQTKKERTSSHKNR